MYLSRSIVLVGVFQSVCVDLIHVCVSMLLICMGARCFHSMHVSVFLSVARKNTLGLFNDFGCRGNYLPSKPILQRVEGKECEGLRGGEGDWGVGGATQNGYWGTSIFWLVC